MKILKLPMGKSSTLIYFVNNFQPEREIVTDELVETRINNFLASVTDDDKSPSELIIENILNFARSYEVLQTEETGLVEMNLN